MQNPTIVFRSPPAASPPNTMVVPDGLPVVNDPQHLDAFVGHGLPLSLSEPQGVWVHHADLRLCARDSLLFGLTCHRAARSAAGGAL